MAAELDILAFSGIVTEVAKSYVSNHFTGDMLIFKYQSYINDLNNQVRELRNKKDRE